MVWPSSARRRSAPRRIPPPRLRPATSSTSSGWAFRHLTGGGAGLPRRVAPSSRFGRGSAGARWAAPAAAVTNGHRFASRSTPNDCCVSEVVLHFRSRRSGRDSTSAVSISPGPARLHSHDVDSRVARVPSMSLPVLARREPPDRPVRKHPGSPRSPRRIPHPAVRHARHLISEPTSAIIGRRRALRPERQSSMNALAPAKQESGSRHHRRPASAPRGGPTLRDRWRVGDTRFWYGHSLDHVGAPIFGRSRPLPTCRRRSVRPN